MILIAGAGISGLSLAFRLSQRQIDFTLLEAAPDAGGKIRSIQRDGFLMDTGPNTLLADAEVMAFLEEAGLSTAIQFPNELSKKRFLFRDGRFHGLSAHPFSLALSPLISCKGKWRIWQERNIKSQSGPDESLASFVRRRFGEEALDWIASPVQYGIHAADPEKLLVGDAFPALLQLEKKHGSVIQGLQKTSGGHRAKTISFQGGMQMLSRKLAARLGDRLRLHTMLQKIEQTTSGWNCHILSNGEVQMLQVSQVVLCIPAPQAALVMRNSGFIEMASELEKVRYQPLAVAHMVFPKSKDREFQGFGGLIPPAAGFCSAGAIWTSSIFPDRAPAGQHLLAGFFGGALHPEASDFSEEQISQLFQKENPAVYGRSAMQFPDVTIWKEAVPGYDLARKQAVQKLEEIVPPKLHFLSNWKGGIGLADCIRNAAKIASAIS